MNNRLLTLKLNPVRYVPDAHGVVPAEDHLLPEGLHAMLKVSGCEQDISSHHLVLLLLNMILQVLFPGHFNSFFTNAHLDHHILLAHLVHTVAHLAVQLLQLRCEVGTPPHVTRSEGEEYLEAVNQDIVRFTRTSLNKVRFDLNVIK